MASGRSFDSSFLITRVCFECLPNLMTRMCAGESKRARDKGGSERANEFVRRMKFLPINTHYSSSHQRLTTALPLQPSHAASQRDASQRWRAGDAANCEVSAFYSGSQDARHRRRAHAQMSFQFMIPALTAPFMIPIDGDK